ncbi:MAG: putative sulfate exporter family transporter [Bacteroidales bacterium]|nr:putative sulfate exporter family transporter [Bacteroidales bacterium]
MTKIPTFLKNEDILSTFIGAILLAAVIFFPDFFKAQPEIYQTHLFSLIATLPIFAVGVKLMGEKVIPFAVSFVAIFAISILSQYISTIPYIKKLGFESVFIAVTIGLLIRNTIGLPKWLAPAIKSEYFIKAGLVILGSSIIFGEIMKAGALGMLQAIVVVFCVWNFSFWIAKKMGVDEEMGIMLSSAVSICGVSAAIATCGAIKGDGKKLSFVVSLVLICAVPMMYVMPLLSRWLGLGEEVAGAWLGGTIDTTGAVVASGKFLGETAEKYSVIIKSSQNVLLGVAAFFISIYWSLKQTHKETKPSPKLIWERFPKFVIGFVLASLVFSFLLEPTDAKALSKIAKGLRETIFSIAFVSIGLETDFRQVFTKENAKYTKTFLTAQSFNIIITLVMALLIFGSAAYLSE